jgi:hypothetical protein
VDFMNPLLVVEVRVATVFLGAGTRRGGYGCVSTRSERPPKRAFMMSIHPSSSLE